MAGQSAAKVRLCVVCRERPRKGGGNAKVCGDECAAALRDARKKYAGGFYVTRCVVCDATVKRKLGRSGGRNRSTCSKECRDVLGYARRVASAKGGKTPCRNCGAPLPRFKSSGRPRKFCSNSCRTEHARAERGYVARVMHCDWCGDAFETKRSQQKYCSKSCKTRSYRSREQSTGGSTHERRCRKHGTHFEVVHPETVFQRDRWICQLCFAHIDPDAKWPDPASATLDHIQPISQGGAHVLSNLQAAHAACNLAKSNRKGLGDGAAGACAQITRSAGA